ncbi:unnamed protein product [Calypogeia fissa]
MESGGEKKTRKSAVAKKRKKFRGKRRDAIPPDDSSAVREGAGINAGFTMLKPKRKRPKNGVVDDDDFPSEPFTSAPSLRPSRFLDNMRARLSGGRFRMLNETLYTCRGEDAFQLFKKDPASFTLYHTGYQEQMSRWPVLPVEVVISWLKARSPKLVVADFGCGDARLAKSVKNKVFSLDLISADPSVIACNMAHTPLATDSVDVAVFCLSLMGTDYPRFLEEAYRVLKPSGFLLIAEVRSRFDIENGGASPQQFVEALLSLGFSLFSQDVTNKMFILFYMQKQKGSGDSLKRSKHWPELKACMYKRR